MYLAQAPQSLGCIIRSFACLIIHASVLKHFLMHSFAWQVVIRGRLALEVLEKFCEELRGSRSRTCTAALVRCAHTFSLSRWIDHVDSQPGPYTTS